MTVEQYLQKDVETIRRDAPVGDAAQLMREAGIGCLIVVDAGNHPVGIVTDRDLAMRVVAAERDPLETRVEHVMTEPLISVEHQDSIDTVLELMAREGIRRAPVVARGGWCGGIVTLDDVLLELSKELRDLALGSRGRVRSTRRHAHVENAASHIEEWVSDALSWMGDQGRHARQTAQELVTEMRELVRGKKDPS